jgi:hypothetical protein
LEDQNVDGRMESKGTLRRLVGGRYRVDIWLRIAIVGGLL